MLFKRAKHILYKQQTKTGVAILGNPIPELISVPKFQGSLKVDQLIHGEHIAQAALATELLVLDVAQIPRIEQCSYTGRSQYPRYKYKPLIRNTKTKDCCPHLMFWGLVKQNIAHSRTMFEGGLYDGLSGETYQ